jgi:hypothetical protein
MFQEIVVSHNGIMTPGLIRGDLDRLGVSFLLVNFAYSYFVAAVDLVFSGQLPSCYAVLRMCLESVVYAHAIVVSPELGAIWMRRNDTPTDKDRFRTDFKITNLINALPEEDPVPRTAVDELYKTTISYGGILTETAYSQSEDGFDPSNSREWKSDCSRQGSLCSWH